MQRKSALSRRAAEPASLREEAVELHVALSRLVRLYQYRDRDRICCHDISVTQCHALEVLVERGPLRSQALAGALRLDKSTTTRVVDALQRKGYVEREADAQDARAVLLRVTRSGRALHARIEADLVDQQEALLRELDPALRAAAAEVVRRLAAAAESRFLAAGLLAGCTPAACD